MFNGMEENGAGALPAIGGGGEPGLGSVAGGGIGPDSGGRPEQIAKFVRADRTVSVERHPVPPMLVFLP